MNMVHLEVNIIEILSIREGKVYLENAVSLVTSGYVNAYSRSL